MTIENTIIAKIVVLLGNITIAKGYSFNLKSIVEWRDSDLAESELDAVEVRDISNLPAEDDEMEHLLSIELTYVSAGGTTPAVHRARVQEIITASSAIEDQSYVTGAELLGLEKDVEKQKKRFMKTVIHLGVLYNAERWNI